MIVGRTCKEVTHLVLQAEDKPLRLSDRVAVRLHMLICRACPRFVEQMIFMRKASARWRQHSEE